jgi:hypothetical protein
MAKKNQHWMVIWIFGGPFGRIWWTIPEMPEAVDERGFFLVFFL